MEPHYIDMQAAMVLYMYLGMCMCNPLVYWSLIMRDGRDGATGGSCIVGQVVVCRGGIYVCTSRAQVRSV